MKKILILFATSFLSYATQAQVAIGKQSVDGAAILDFAPNTTNGIILPVVRTLPTGAGASDGTLLINAVNLSAAKAQARVNGTWIDISDDVRNLSAINLNTTPEQGTIAIMGASTSSASGVLVLEATNKALVLPKISNAETEIKSPVAGTMVYDMWSKSLAIFDGVKWNFWK
ncbi:MAG: hypothetical protein ACKOXV_00320 [Bacteroidota bacterium]